MASPVASTSALSTSPVHEMASPELSRKRKAPSTSDDVSVDDSLQESSPCSSTSSTPSKATSGRKKPTDEERRARLEARQARNRQSAQNSRERKKVYVEQLESNVTSLKAENAILRQQKEQDQLIKLTLEAKVRDVESRVQALETLIRHLVKSADQSQINSLIAAASSTSAAAATSSLAATTAASLSPATYLPATVPSDGSLSIAAPVASASIPSLSTPVASTPLEQDTRLPAAGVHHGSTGVMGAAHGAGEGSGSNVAVNGSSIDQTSVLTSGPVGLVAGQEAAIEQQADATQSQSSDAKQHASQGAVEALDISSFIDLNRLGGSDSHSSSADQAQGTPTPSGQAGTSVPVPSPVPGTATDRMSGSADGVARGASDVSSTEPAAADVQNSFQLLTSTFTPTMKSAEELATDALLAEIYGQSNRDVGDGEDSWMSQQGSESESSGSPFDLVDLDVEIEQPISFADNVDANGATTLGVGAAGVVNWQSFLASIAA